MCGCAPSWPASAASRVNRSRATASAASSEASTLIATRRESRRSHATYTAPIPPRASSRAELEPRGQQRLAQIAIKLHGNLAGHAAEGYANSAAVRKVRNDPPA